MIIDENNFEQNNEKIVKDCETVNRENVEEQTDNNMIDEQLQPLNEEGLKNSLSCEQKKIDNKKEASVLKRLVSSVSIGLFTGIVMGAAFLLVLKIGGGFDKTSQGNIINITVESTPIIGAPEGEIVSTSISTVAEHVMPSVVSITNLSVQQVDSFFWGTQEYEVESSGSGIIIGTSETELLIATNNHVVENNKALTVTFVDNTSVEAVVKGSDANIDIAVIAVKISEMTQETLDAIKIATIGDSASLIVGEPAIAIGNALGYGQSVTSGIVSAVNRKLDGFDTTLIQTDAAINPGNSGGALLNIRGEVIGINTAKITDTTVEGVCYAIPITEVKSIIEEMMLKETREKVPEEKRGKLGITCVDVDDMAAMYYNMPKGAYINEVVKGGAADNAGITKGGIITKFDGTSIGSSTALVDLLAYYEVGETIKINIAVPTSTGDYETKMVDVTLQKD